MRRILARLDYFFAFLLGALGILLLSVRAWSGDHLALGLLISFSFVWLCFSISSGLAWRHTLKDWRHTLDLWKETSEYGSDLHSLFMEALHELATYDQDKAEEISARADTIALLRMKNITERSTP